jgi:chromate transporter
MFRLEREAIGCFSFAGQCAKIGRKRKNEELRMKKISTLFGTFLKIGAFTFGGGYAMVALLEHEFVEEKQWMSREEFLDMVAIAESTPGPVAVNSATYIGYKIGGTAGAAASTAAVSLPSFVVIYIISLFFDRFLSLTVVANAFKGIQACVVYLILSAGLKMLKQLKKDTFDLCILAAVVAAMVGCSLAAVSFSSIYYILLSGAAGVLVWLVKKAGAGK